MPKKVKVVSESLFLIPSKWVHYFALVLSVFFSFVSYYLFLLLWLTNFSWLNSTPWDGKKEPRHFSFINRLHLLIRNLIGQNLALLLLENIIIDITCLISGIYSNFRRLLCKKCEICALLIAQWRIISCVYCPLKNILRYSCNLLPGRKKRIRAHNLAAVWGIVSFFGGRIRPPSKKDAWYKHCHQIHFLDHPTQ